MNTCQTFLHRYTISPIWSYMDFRLFPPTTFVCFIYLFIIYNVLGRGRWETMSKYSYWICPKGWPLNNQKPILIISSAISERKSLVASFTLKMWFIWLKNQPMIKKWNPTKNQTANKLYYFSVKSKLSNNCSEVGSG